MTEAMSIGVLHLALRRPSEATPKVLFSLRGIVLRKEHNSSQNRDGTQGAPNFRFHGLRIED
jgi:hypothetical protein